MILVENDIWNMLFPFCKAYCVLTFHSQTFRFVYFGQSTFGYFLRVFRVFIHVPKHIFSSPITVH